MGVIATGASGSIGGLTVSRNRYGFYARARTTPVNPNTGRQMAARARFAAAANLWSASLTQAYRDGWQTYADAIVWKGSLGLDCKLTGFAHFLRSCTSRLCAGLFPVLPAPVLLTLPESDPYFETTVDEAGQEISVAFDNALGWANETGGAMLISMSSPKGEGRDYIGGPFRTAGVILGVTGTPPTSPEVIDCPFPVAEDQKVDCIASILRVDGRVSQPFQFTSSVTA